MNVNNNCATGSSALFLAHEISYLTVPTFFLAITFFLLETEKFPRNSSLGAVGKVFEKSFGLKFE